jgi:hypothetical protein
MRNGLKSREAWGLSRKGAGDGASAVKLTFPRRETMVQLFIYSQPMDAASEVLLQCT